MKAFQKILIATLFFFTYVDVPAQIKDDSENGNAINFKLLKRNLEIYGQSLPDTNYLKEVSVKTSNEIMLINERTLLLSDDFLRDLSVYELRYLQTQQQNILKDMQGYRKGIDVLKNEMMAFKQEMDTIYLNLKRIEKDSLYMQLDTLVTDSLFSLERDSIISGFKTVSIDVDRSKEWISIILADLEQEAGLLNELDNIQSENLARIEKMIEGKLGIKSSPIWSIGRKDNFSESTLDNLKDSIKNIKEYIHSHEWRFYTHVLVYIVLLGIALYFKRQKVLWKKYQEREDEIVHVLHPLKNPLTASFLLALSFTSWIHYGAPADFFDVMLILLPIPILIFIYRFGLYVLFKETFLFSVVFFFIHFQHFIIFNSFFHRLALLVFSGSLIYIINRIQVNYKGEYLKTFKYLYRAATLLLGLAILCNVIGYFELSQFLINEIAASIILAALFHISSLVVTDMIKLFLLSDQMQRFNSIRKNYDTIKKNVQKLIGILALFAWLTVVLKNSGFYNEVTGPIIDFLFSSRSIGSVTYTIWGLLLFIFTIFISFKLSRILEEIFKEDLSGNKHSHKRNIGALTVMVRYGVITLGLLLAVAFSGLPVENITIIIGALGVGIGFGLQNIFNNLVSGFILAIERPINIGDIIQVDPYMGEVQDIGIRASKVKSFDGAEVIIPNGDLISNNVINWTHSDRHKRIEIFIGVAYGTDTDTVIGLIEKAISDCQGIMEIPKPMVIFHKFGESSLDFRILCWTTIDSFLSTKSQLSISIDKIFKENGITIPFPQRDLYIKQIETKNPLTHNGNDKNLKLKKKSIE